MDKKQTKRRHWRFTDSFKNKVVALILLVAALVTYKHTGYGEVLAFMFWPIIFMALADTDVLGLWTK